MAGEREDKLPAALHNGQGTRCAEGLRVAARGKLRATLRSISNFLLATHPYTSQAGLDIPHPA